MLPIGSSRALYPALFETPVCAFCATAGRESHPALKINLKSSITQNLALSIGLKELIIALIMQDLLMQIHKRLLKTGRRLATAESCTGGLLSSLLTQLPGSSAYFILGAVTYSNQAKVDILRIPPAIIREKGAVSPEIALRMAKNVRKLAKTDFGIGITGIAGPTGGSPQKPVGTVFISLSSKNKNACKKFVFKGNRSSVRKQAALKALQLLKTFL